MYYLEEKKKKSELRSVAEFRNQKTDFTYLWRWRILILPRGDIAEEKPKTKFDTSCEPGNHFSKDKTFIYHSKILRIKFSLKQNKVQ